MYQLTRRRLLQTGMGAVAGAAVAGTPAFARRGRRGAQPPGDGRYVGEIRLFPGTYVPDGWLPCDGDQFDPRQYPQLANVIGTTYSGGESEPRLPDLRGRTAIGAGGRPGEPHRTLGEHGDGLAAKGKGPAGLGLQYMISPTGGEGVQLLAEIRPLAFHYNPESWALCQGERIEIRSRPDLFSLLGDSYGGDGRSHFLLPNLGGRSPLGVGRSGRVPEVQLGQKLDDLDPEARPHSRRLHVNYCIALDGFWPSRPNHRPGRTLPTMIGELRAFASAQVPEGWLVCHGQVVSIRLYRALFSVIGNAYGGDGRETFALPDLNGRSTAGTGDTSDGTYRVGDTSAHPPVREVAADRTLPFNTITWGIAGETFDYPPHAR